MDDQRAAVMPQQPDGGRSSADAIEQNELLHPPRSGGEPVIVAQELSKSFGDQVAVDKVTFEVERGMIFGYVGPSGSGKTTSIRLLTGVERPTSGKVAVLERDPTRFTESLRRRIGYMPQHFVLYPDLSVEENLNFAASIYGMSPFRGKRIREMLDFVELSADRYKLTRHLSGGMQRRLNLAATLIHEPDLLFLDEPTAGIDPVLRRKIWDRIKELRAQGRTFFVTTQYVADTANCDMVGIMDEGRLLHLDTPEGLRRLAYGGDIVHLKAANPIDYHQIDQLSALPVVKAPVARLDDSSVRMVVDEAKTAIPTILDSCKASGLPVQSVEPYYPPYDDVFVELLRKEHERG